MSVCVFIVQVISTVRKACIGINIYIYVYYCCNTRAIHIHSEPVLISLLFRFGKKVKEKKIRS